MGTETLMLARRWTARSAACAAAFSTVVLSGGGAAAQAPAEAAPAPAASAQPPGTPAKEEQAPDGGDIERAREQFRKGLELTAARRFIEALAAFQLAYDLSPTYRILYNIGQVSRHVGDPARSLRAFERYLAEGGQEIDVARRAEVEAEIAALRALVGALRVRVEPAGAAVLLDGARVGEAPLAGPLYVNPGVHRLRAERAGRQAAIETVEVTAGRALDIALTLGPATPSAAPGRDRPAPPPAATGRPTWIGWVVTGALAAGAAVTGTAALVSAAQLDDARYAGPDRRPSPDSDVSALGDRVDALALATDVLALAAAASLGVTLYFTLSDPGRSSGGRTGAAPAGARVVVGATPGGAWIRGAF